MLHDPGGKSLFSMQPGVSGAAYITPDEKHRLFLSRVWGPGARYVAFVGLNPSTARPDMDDPTIRRDIGFAQRLGFDGMFKLNPFTYRVTDPKQLLALPATERVHTENQHVLKKVCARCSQVVVAHGVVHRLLRAQVAEAMGIIKAAKPELWCLGLTQSGWPRHTLYLRSDAELQIFHSPT